MTPDILATAASLSDNALLARVQALAGRERQAACELIAHLAELDTRRLGLSEDAAYTRVEVARAARRFPMILEALADGLAPRPDVPSTIRKVPMRGPAPRAEPPCETPPRSEVPPLALGDGAPPTSAPGSSPAVVTLPATVAPQVSRRPAIAPLSPRRYHVQFTVGQETHDKLRRLQDLLRREIRSGDPEEIVDRALTLLLRDVERKKLAATSRPRPTRSGTTAPRRQEAPTRDIPAALCRAVWKRDDSRCAYVSPSGHRCPERTFLQVHHIHP